MEIYFKLPKSIIKMKDRIDIERNGYLTTSSLNGQEKSVLAHYKKEEKAIRVLNQIDKILDTAIKNKSNAISIEIPFDE